MVVRCYVCKCYKSKNNEEKCSFHRLPVNSQNRSIWLSLLGCSSDQQFSAKRIDICSRHFQKDDLIRKPNGTTVLKSGAVPLLANPLLFETKSSSSTSSSSSDNAFLKNTFHVEKASSTSSICEILETEDEPGKHSELCLRLAEMASNAAINNSSTNMQLENFKSTTETASESERLQTSTVKKKFVRKRKHYCGDLSSSDFSSPKKAKENFKIMKHTINLQKKKIKTLQENVWLLKKRIKNVKDLMVHLKSKSYITQSQETLLMASLPEPALKLFERMMKNSKTQKYDEKLRSFALTLAFYSPKAYNFVRNTFNKKLPHLHTITKWYTSVDGSPGFTDEALKTLKFKQEQAAKENKILLCNLAFDEMSIRKQVEWTGSKFSGYVDINSKFDSDVLPEAKEALVFMVVCINEPWKIPVGYFLLDGLGAKEKAELINKCLRFLHESGVIISSIVFDGAPVNLSAMAELGANFKDFLNMKTFFLHPVTADPVYILLDPCHMLKLVRNTFGSQKKITDSSGRLIEWKFLEYLVEVQYTEGLHLGTKLKHRHLTWTKEKMKVKLASQTLSKSVADALLYLSEDLKLDKFQNVAATVKFIQIFNDVFDIFNSRNQFVKYCFKEPLKPENVEERLKFLEDAVIYIHGLTLNNVPILKSNRKTGFLGFIICVVSLKALYYTYVVKNSAIKLILTHRLSQDHLELFFGAIRSKGGYNNNPTARQFEGAYKKQLVHTEISGPNTGNVTNPEHLVILSCGSGSRVTINEEGENLLHNRIYLDYEKEMYNMATTDFIHSSAWDLTCYVQDVVGYIAGFVVKCLKRCVTCEKCLNLLEDEDIISPLQKRKEFGKLIKASSLIIDVCKVAEKCFRFFQKTSTLLNSKNNKIISILIQNAIEIIPKDALFKFYHQLFDDDPIDGHGITLVKLFLRKYFNLRIHHELNKNLDSFKKSRTRNTLTKTILFRNE